MSIIMQDPVRLKTPSRSPVRPVAVRGGGAASGKREVSFELESRGGYRRMVTGTIEYLDDEAQTYMVRAPDRGMIRVPLRDIKTTIDRVA